MPIQIDQKPDEYNNDTRSVLLQISMFIKLIKSLNYLILCRNMHSYLHILISKHVYVYMLKTHQKKFKTLLHIILLLIVVAFYILNFPTQSNGKLKYKDSVSHTIAFPIKNFPWRRTSLLTTIKLFIVIELL